MTTYLDAAPGEIECLRDFGNHYVCKGRRSIALAATLLKQDEIVAFPTDTIYGLAGVVSSNTSIEKLYKIKDRDENKPLSISISSVKHIGHWGIIDHIPRGLLTTILPGPYTIILKRTQNLNPAFNPNHDTVGIRVPHFKFINCVAKIVGPLALTSANVSNEPSCLYASEFEHLWPRLGAIFHDSNRFGTSVQSLRKGSTIVDLSEPEYYKIVRFGVGAKSLISFLNSVGLECLED
ncbi:YrdC domain-containing protein, mitochondrial [Habropoda laboriosa]|uniref:Threonylcarbamoyl-AMP synthase n=1 Tax=Habropoda laboriosa TaxID=597456 RepID=A0A0L7RCG1_9HYME|nr:PREDICTED: yrdC domain-containing protein, mitochondrial [Habropoda laboriosa]KOC68426.1 YrdC domain-containing protein, mitochondrial [Habropoda laboriosa]